MFLKALVILASTLTLSGYAKTQNPPSDSLKVDYFAYANTAGVPDGTLRLMNPGSAGASSLCAAIYVFNSAQELTECCSCLLSPNGLRTLSVNTDLAGSPANGVIINTGTISIVPTTTTGGQCPLPTKLTPVSGGVRSWVTHIDEFSGSLGTMHQTSSINGFTGTPAASQDATLSSYEETILEEQCHGIQIMSGNGGVCTCGTGN